ncbi:MAG: hypothetical protein ABIH25_03190 [Candidatus Woesearchaeota archaeon]
MRGESKRNVLDKFCIDFCEIVEKFTKYIIVSGFVAISSGRARATEDIDMIIPKISKDIFIKMHNDLIKNDFVCMQSDDPTEIYKDYLKNDTSVRYTYKNRPLPEMEIKLSKDELDDYQLTTRVKLKLTGLDVWFSSIDMNIAFKEEYLKSPKDLEDAKHLRDVYSDLIDEEEIKKIKKMIREKRLK